MRTPSGVLVALHLAVLPMTLAAQQAIETDRPDFTEAASVVRARGVQLEAGYAVEPGNDLAEAAVEALVRVGLGHQVEARLGWLDAHRASLGVKVHLGGSDDRGLAFLAGASLPRNGSAGDRRVTPVLQLTGSRSFGRVALGAMSGLTLTGGEVGAGFVQTVVVAPELVGPLSGFVEYAAEFGGAAPAVHLGHAGLTLGVAADVQLDLHAAIPLGDAGSGLVGAGAAFRFRFP